MAIVGTYGPGAKEFGILSSLYEDYVRQIPTIEINKNDGTVTITKIEIQHCPCCGQKNGEKIYSKTMTIDEYNKRFNGVII